MVTLVKPFAGNPYWHKNVLKQLGIAERVRNLKNEKKKRFRDNSYKLAPYYPDLT